MPTHFNLFLRDEKRREDIEQERAPALPRPAFVFPFLFASIFTLVGLWGMREGVLSAHGGVGLASRGQVTQATITRMYTSESDGSTNYHIVYTYTAPDAAHAHKRSTTISKKEWRATCQGCKIDVRYDPERPHFNRLTNEWPISSGVSLVAFMSLFAALGLGLSWNMVSEQRRYWRIRRRGTLRMGTILDVSDEERGEDNDLFITLQLQLDGDDAILPYTWSDNTLRGKLPQVGQRIAAIYLSDTNFELV